MMHGTCNNSTLYCLPPLNLHHMIKLRWWCTLPYFPFEHDPHFCCNTTVSGKWFWLTV
jgi:hypothetical protein